MLLLLKESLHAENCLQLCEGCLLRICCGLFYNGTFIRRVSAPRAVIEDLLVLVFKGEGKKHEEEVVALQEHKKSFKDKTSITPTHTTPFQHHLSCPHLSSGQHSAVRSSIHRIPNRSQGSLLKQQGNLISLDQVLNS